VIWPSVTNDLVRVLKRHQITQKKSGERSTREQDVGLPTERLVERLK
jgi:hypothetical protein